MSGFTGGPGNDIYMGDATDEVISGKGGDDTLFGADGADAIDGGSGNDVIGDGSVAYDQFHLPTYTPDSSADVLKGGDGNDFIAAGYGDSLDGGAGTDSFRLDMSASSAAMVVDLSGFAATGALTFTGGTKVKGMESGTIIFGSGDDTITLGSSALTVDGGAGADNITGGGLADHIYGGTGADTIEGGDGDDVLGDGTQQNFFFGVIDHPDTSADTLHGGLGNDTLYGGSGDTLDGGDGQDAVSLQSTFTGGVNVNLSDSMNGGTLVVGDSTLTSIEWGVIQLLGGGNDTVKVGGWTSAILLLGGGNDKATGGAGADIFQGGAGNDVLSGGGGDDTFWGGVGGLGSDGNDTYNGGAGTDTVDYGQLIVLPPPSGVTVSLAVSGPQDTGPGGVDTLVSIENLRGTFSDDHLTGDAGANTLDGSSGNDVLNGGKGADQLIGGFGADTLTGGAGADHFVYTSIYDASTGTDTITDLGAGDVIDLSAIDGDGNDSNGHTPFVVSDHVVDGVADAVLTYDKASGYTHLDLYVDGDMTVDGSIQMAGKHLDASILT